MTDTDNPKPPIKVMQRNPVYDEVLTLWTGQLHIPTNNSKNRLYRKKLSAAIREKVKKDRKSNIVYNENILLSIHIFGSDSYIKKADTDNFAKFILDTFKTVLFTDDKLIYTLMVFKEASKWNGLWLGIKQFYTGFPAYPYFPLMSDLPIWTPELYSAAGRHLRILEAIPELDYPHHSNQ